MSQRESPGPRWWLYLTGFGVMSLSLGTVSFIYFEDSALRTGVPLFWGIGAFLLSLHALFFLGKDVSPFYRGFKAVVMWPLVLAVGFPALLDYARVYWRTARAEGCGSRAVAVVEGVDQAWEEKQGHYYVDVVYTLEQGQRYRNRFRVTASAFQGVEVGQQVDLVYCPDKPSVVVPRDLSLATGSWVRWAFLVAPLVLLLWLMLLRLIRRLHG